MNKVSRPNLAKEPPIEIAEDDIQLVGDWNIIATSFEGTVREMKKNMKYIYMIILLVLFAFIITGIFFAVFSDYNPLIIFSSIFPITVFIITIMIFFTRFLVKRVMDPNVNREVKAGWEKVGRKKALDSLKEFCERRGVDYRFVENRDYRRMGWKEPEHKFIFNDGIIIKGMYQVIDWQAAGWVAIEYPGDIWESALKVQIELDSFLAEKKVIYEKNKKRPLFKTKFS